MTTSQLSEHAQNAADAAKTQVTSVAHDVATDVRDQVADDTQQTADAAQSAADAFTAGSLQAVALEQVAERLDSFSRSLQTRSVEGLVDDVAVFARKNPLLFLGGAALAGFAAARFLKATPDNSHAADDPWSNHLADYEGRD